MKRINLTGKRFGRLLVVGLHSITNHKPRWKCKCDCGSALDVNGSNLKTGTTKSCGCLQVDLVRGRLTTHGQSRRSPEYNTWSGMLARCRSKSNPAYSNYGGRGVKACKRWLKFETFFEDMGKKPTAAHSIERRNNDGDYKPSNCYWATKRQQALNTRQSVGVVNHNGKSMTIEQWSKHTGIKLKTIYWRLKRWSVEKSLSKTISRP